MSTRDSFVLVFVRWTAVLLAVAGVIASPIAKQNTDSDLWWAWGVAGIVLGLVLGLLWWFMAVAAETRDAVVAMEYGDRMRDRKEAKS
jgi:peptidoglycan/LPS O-acetylase OafA/YrhL